MLIKKDELRTLASMIFQSDINQIYISEFLENWLVSEKDTPLLDAQDIIVESIDSLKAIIKQIIDRHEKEVTISKYNFSSYNTDVLIKSSLLADEEQKLSIENRIHWRDKMAEFIQNISWREFELLAKFILEYNGLKNITITQAVNDQGLDFYGYFKPTYSTLSPRFLSDINLRIVGQVKHSAKNNKVNPSKISSFGTEINRLRKKLPPNYFKELPDFFFDSPLPIVGIFIANSLYLPKAESFSKDYGIIVWNGNQISEDLSNNDFSSKIINEDGNLSLEKLKLLLKQ